MKTIKEILAITILVLCAIMTVSTWDTPGNTGWLIALVGWLEIVINQRKDPDFK